MNSEYTIPNCSLYKALYEAHYQASRRVNSSTQALMIAWQSNGEDLIKSITCALMTFGGKHAPIKSVYEMLIRLDNELIQDVIKDYAIIPGFGSSFYRGEPDPSLSLLKNVLFYQDKMYLTLVSRIQLELINARDSRLYPNLAFYTAAVSHHLKINIKFCEALMLQARIDAWCKILSGQETIQQKEISE